MKRAKISLVFLMVAVMLVTILPASMSFAEEKDYTTEAVIECLSKKTSVTANNIKSDDTIISKMYYVNGGSATIADGNITIPFYDIYSMNSFVVGSTKLDDGSFVGGAKFTPATTPEAKTVTDVTYKLIDFAGATFEKVTIGTDVYYCTTLVLNSTNASGEAKTYESRLGFALAEADVEQAKEDIKNQAIADTAVQKIIDTGANSKIGVAFLKDDNSKKAGMMTANNDQVLYDGTNLVLNVTISGDHQMLAAVVADKTYTADKNGQVTIPVADLYGATWAETTLENCQYAVRIDVQYSNPSSGEDYGTFKRCLAFNFNAVEKGDTPTTTAAETTTVAATTTDATSPKTGDSSAFIVYTIVALFAVAIGTVTVIVKRRENR